MGYNILLDREPTDQEIESILSDAIAQARQKKEQAMLAFNLMIHEQLLAVKQQTEGQHDQPQA